jgi:murein DD-endopeptidase MepM/ murein hydrolase activator NlpD
MLLKCLRAGFFLITAVLVGAACSPRQTIVIVITATPTPLSLPIQSAGEQPTPEPTAPAVALLPVAQPSVYTIQPGDTLSTLALQYGTTVEILASLNALPNPDLLEVGQVIRLPATVSINSPSGFLLPDHLLIRAPGAVNFNIRQFIEQQPGYIRTVAEPIGNELRPYTAAEIVERVALEFSVDPRMLLATLEMRANWLTQPTLSDEQKSYPIIDTAALDGVDRRGLYRQLAWTANQLNWGFYSWKYYGNQLITFVTGKRASLSPSLNAGTIGVQYLVSRLSTPQDWELNITALIQVYNRLFGLPPSDPAAMSTTIDPLQPDLALPFRPGDTWFYTGGHHGAWGRGSAWGAVDFAPPDERPDGSSFCYVSQFPITAVTPGIIARSGDGTVILDLDNDGDESTGWTILYLHIATEGRVPVGTQVQTGDTIGYASCEGGVSNATHMHIARRYNGEWIPNACDACAVPRSVFPAFNMSGWVFYGLADQEYQGYAQRDGAVVLAEQGRINTNNRIQLPGD